MPMISVWYDDAKPVRSRDCCSAVNSGFESVLGSFPQIPL